MMRILDDTNAASVAVTVLDSLEEAGYPFNEAIPGLVLAICKMAEVEGRPYNESMQILDEAMDLLNDGGAVGGADIDGDLDDDAAYIDPEVNG